MTGSVEKPVRTAGVFARPAVLRGSALWNVAAVVAAALHVPSADAQTRARSTMDDVDRRAPATGEAKSPLANCACYASPW